MDGIRQCFLHPCQKQESIKITVLCFSKTISGFPKYLLEFLRYLKPFFQSSLRNSVSILLSLLFTQDIISLRFCFDTVSIRNQLSKSSMGFILNCNIFADSRPASPPFLCIVIFPIFKLPWFVILTGPLAKIFIA